MTTFQINGQTIEFDETLSYADFWVDGSSYVFAWIQWDKILTALSEGREWDAGIRRFVKLLSRWVHEAPRKRVYRGLKMSGVTVVSSEFFFEQQGGDEMINSLESTGKFAVRLLEVYDESPMEPIKHEGRNPIRVDQLKIE